MTEWQNRIIGLEWKAANQLLANPDNPREHPTLQRDTLRGSLDDIGWYDVVIENRLTGYLIDGHARVEEALSKDENMLIPVLVVEMNANEQDAATLSHDWITQLATYNHDKTDVLLKRVQMTDEFSWIWGSDELETTRSIDSRTLKRESKHKALSALKRENAVAILTALPEPNESLHIVSNGQFDYFTFVAVVLDLLPQHYSTHFYGSTWTMSRNNVIELFELFDAGKLGSLNMLTGTYFKRRESSVYATLLTGIQERKQRYLAFENHAKVMLFNHEDTYITIEGSANFTANPRLEQTTIINNYDLWAFHKSWMDEMLNGG